MKQQTESSRQDTIRVLFWPDSCILRRQLNRKETLPKTTLIITQLPSHVFSFLFFFFWTLILTNAARWVSGEKYDWLTSVDFRRRTLTKPGVTSGRCENFRDKSVPRWNKMFCFKMFCFKIISVFVGKITIASPLVRQDPKFDKYGEFNGLSIVNSINTLLSERF